MGLSNIRSSQRYTGAWWPVHTALERWAFGRGSGWGVAATPDGRVEPSLVRARLLPPALSRRGRVRSPGAIGGVGWKRFGVPVGLLLAGGLAACSPNAYLEPAPAAMTVPHQEDADVGQVAGVRVVANGAAWRANPPDLGSVFTPVKVDIHNESGAPVDIRYKDFELTTAGFTSMALPPYKVSGSVETRPLTVVPVVPAFAYRRFFIAPYYASFYDWDFDRWTGPFPWDFGYYRTYYPMWRESLPTLDMRAEAIPEGVLNPDGRLSGFVYFQKIDRKAGPVTLTFDVVNADNGKSLSKVELPFVAK